MEAPEGTVQGTNNDTSIVVNFTVNSGTVTVQAQNGCGNSPIRSLSVLVQAPDSTFSINPNPTGTNYSTQCLPNLTGQGITHSWLFQNGNPASSSSANPSVQWSSAGTYAVQHSITDAQETKIPFHNVGEASFHIDMSNVLAIRVKERILELNSCDTEERKVLEDFISNSLTVMIDGYVNLLMSIQQGYLK